MYIKLRKVFVHTSLNHPVSQKNKILTNFENCNDNLWTPCISNHLGALIIYNVSIFIAWSYVGFSQVKSFKLQPRP